jgi:hypothetical protein
MGIPISELKHLSYKMLNEILQDRIETNKKTKTKANGRNASQSDINGFLG